MPTPKTQLNSSPESPKADASTRNPAADPKPKKTLSREKSLAEQMAEPYREMLEEKGERYTKSVLSGARQAAVGLLSPYESSESLRLYQEVEKALFGQLGPLNPGEVDLTLSQSDEPSRQAGARNPGQAESISAPAE